MVRKYEAILESDEAEAARIAALCRAAGIEDPTFTRPEAVARLAVQQDLLWGCLDELLGMAEDIDAEQVGRGRGLFPPDLIDRCIKALALVGDREAEAAEAIEAAGI